MVTFAKPMAPHVVGEQRLVPTAIAEDLERDGMISAAEPWPPRAPNEPPAKPTVIERLVPAPLRPQPARDQRMVKTGPAKRGRPGNR